MTIKKILLAVDFSAGSEKATEVAADMGSRLDAEVHALHVWNPRRRDPVEEWVELSLNFPPGSNVARIIEGHVVTLLRSLVSRLAAAGVRARGRWEAGEPAATIVDFAASGGYSAIVMGTFGRTHVKEALIGSCAERVVRHSPVPVVIVPTHPQDRCPEPLTGRWIADEGPLADP